jgi:hypothetical protein
MPLVGTTYSLQAFLLGGLDVRRSDVPAGRLDDWSLPPLSPQTACWGEANGKGLMLTVLRCARTIVAWLHGPSSREMQPQRRA